MAEGGDGNEYASRGGLTQPPAACLGRGKVGSGKCYAMLCYAVAC